MHAVLQHHDLCYAGHERVHRRCKSKNMKAYREFWAHLGSLQARDKSAHHSSRDQAVYHNLPGVSTMEVSVLLRFCKCIRSAVACLQSCWHLTLYLLQGTVSVLTKGVSSQAKVSTLACASAATRTEPLPVLACSPSLAPNTSRSLVHFHFTSHFRRPEAHSTSLIHRAMTYVPCSMYCIHITSSLARFGCSYHRHKRLGGR